MAGEAEGREELRPSSTSHLAPPPSSEPLALLPALADLTVLCGQRFRDDGRKGSSTFFGSCEGQVARCKHSPCGCDFSMLFVSTITDHLCKGLLVCFPTGQVLNVLRLRGKRFK